MSDLTTLPPLEELFRTHVDFVFRICMRYTRNREEAEDLAQEVFIKIHQTSSSFKGQSSLSTWIYRIAINCCLDHLRMKKRHLEYHEESLSPVVAYNLTGFDDQALARVEMERILSYVRPSVRRILFLALAEGVSYAEIGAMLGMSKSTIAKTVERFLARYRHRHGNDDGDQNSHSARESVSARPSIKSMILLLQRTICTAAKNLLSTLDRLFTSNSWDREMCVLFIGKGATREKT